MICSMCRGEFQTQKPNQRYCSIRCRRKIEIMRRTWDSRKEYIERAEGFASSPKLDQKSRDHWSTLAKLAKERLGARP